MGWVKEVGGFYRQGLIKKKAEIEDKWQIGHLKVTFPTRQGQ
jgi:hypothetical protein